MCGKEISSIFSQMATKLSNLSGLSGLVRRVGADLGDNYCKFGGRSHIFLGRPFNFWEQENIIRKKE